MHARALMDDEPLQVILDELIFRSDDGRFSVMAALDSQQDRLVLVGDLGGAAPGETLRIRGRWQTHATYGERFYVNSFMPVTPTTLAGIKRYLGSGLVPGVRSALAERLVDRFGEDTLEVISTQSGRLREVDGIGRQRATAIAEAVRSRREEAEVMSYLQGLGLGPALSKRIRHKYGARTVAVVRDDPYLVAEEVRGVGFRTADRIGMALGYAPDDPRRAAGAVLHLIGKGADEGHVFVERDILVEHGVALDVPQRTLFDAIDTLAGRGLLIEEGSALYAPVLHRAEVQIARRLFALNEPRRPRKGTAKAIEACTEEDYADAQIEALRRSFEQGLLVLTGGPGTGKTTTVRSIVRAWEQTRGRVTLCAPTGRAAKRLGEATGADASTIHRLLEFNPRSGQFGRNAQEPLETDLLIVDEASMLDVQLAHRLLDALPKTSTLLLVGDVDQLPPVSPGPVLRDLLAANLCPAVRLTEVFRQAKRSTIVRAAHQILGGERPVPTPTGDHGDGDLFVIRTADPETMMQRVLDSLKRMKSAYGLDPVRDVQVLTPMRRGPLGTERLNEAIQAALNPAPRGQPLVEGPTLRTGDKVMQLRNDYERDVFNGDVGEVRSVESGVVTVDMGGRAVSYPRDAQDALTLAYAATIHKVQGSEFPALILLLHGTHYMLLSRPLLYTAVTRAQKLAVIIADDRALARALSNTTVQQTNSRLTDRLRQLEEQSDDPARG